MNKTLIALLFVFALPAMAADNVFTGYESARQALLKGSIADVRTAAKRIAVAARHEKAPKVADLAAALEHAADLKTARLAFATLSDEMIKTHKGKSPVVAYCSMEKKSWLQPAGAIGNPYVDPAMKSCGEIKAR